MVVLSKMNNQNSSSVVESLLQEFFYHFVEIDCSVTSIDVTDEERRRQFCVGFSFHSRRVSRRGAISSDPMSRSQ